MTFERIDVRRPELTELREPIVYLLERLRLQVIEAPLCVSRDLV
jgi:hypothetical protein